MIVERRMQSNRPVYNAPIGGRNPAYHVAYAPPAIPVEPFPVGIRPVVDTTKGMTTIRITLFNGRQSTLDLNLDHTIAEIHTYIMSVAPTSGSYQLMSGYPPQPLANPSITIKEANLQ